MASRDLILIFCNGGNPRLMSIAIEHGYRPGAQLPDTIYPEHEPLYFADQDWKHPNRTLYMDYLARYRPTMATVLDLERPDQLPEVLDWAAEAASWVEKVVIIPKTEGVITQIPPTVAGSEIVLGYSVPTRYGATDLPLEAFAGWPVHLLGGSPHAQMNLYRRFAGKARVISADGNFAGKMALRYCQFWVNGTATHARNRWWPTLREAADGALWRGSGLAYEEAFYRSCANITAAWKEILQCPRDVRGEETPCP